MSRFIIFLLLSAFYSEGTLRLVGGNSKEEGNVEIWHNGKWGGICDDEWDMADAQVACKQLGFSDVLKVTHDSYYGKPKRYWMDNLYCVGTEVNLSLCQFNGWGIHDCSKKEAAGVICYEKNLEANIYEQSIQYIKNDILLRLSNGRNMNEGRVEVKFEANKSWGVICGDGWTLLEANVVCKQKNLGYAVFASQSHFFDSRGTFDVVLSGVKCKGNENYISDCVASPFKTCPGNLIAGVVCEKDIADLLLDEAELEKSSYLEDRPMYLLSCAMEENCLANTDTMKNEIEQYALTKRLLRFTIRAKNIGTREFTPFMPKQLWQFHLCHMHFHSMEVFATFDVLSHEGVKMAEGHKASFCLEDNECSPGTKRKFDCANYGDQGISPNCTDVYKHNIDCQWIDVSNLKFGNYFLKVAINPEFKIAEMRFDNNAALCHLLYTETSAMVYGCNLTDVQ